MTPTTPDPLRENRWERLRDMPPADEARLHVESSDDPLGQSDLICEGCLADWPCDFERGRRSASPAEPVDDPCPHCDMEHVWPCPTIPRCDELGCERASTCGFPTGDGYRRTCGDHYRAALSGPKP